MERQVFFPKLSNFFVGHNKVIQLMFFFTSFPRTLLSNLLDVLEFGMYVDFLGGGVERLKDTHVGTVFQCDEALPQRGKFCVNHWQPVFDHVNHGFHDNMVAPRKTNMDTQDDGLEKVTPQRKWQLLVSMSMWDFWGVNFVSTHGLPKKNMVKTWPTCQPSQPWVFWSINST